jgi:hypothetical protein
MIILEKLMNYFKILKEDRFMTTDQHTNLDLMFKKKGIINYSVNDILEWKKDIILRIRQATRYGDDHFDKYYLPLIKTYSEHVHLLPASEYHHHRNTGGLLSHGLEVGLHSLELFISRKINTSKEGQELCDFDPRLDLISFIVGISHDFGKIADMTITDDSQNLCWKLFDKKLPDWLRQNGIDHYQVRFEQRKHNSHKNMSVFFASSYLLTPELRDYLLAGDQMAIKRIIEAILGTSSTNVFQQCLAKADQASVKKYMKSAPRLPSPAVNAGLAPHEHLCLAMSRLFAEETWKINIPGEVGWLIENELYLSWPRAAQEATKLLAADATPRIPHDPEIVAQTLSDWGIINERSKNNPYWIITPGGMGELKAVQLARPTSWMATLTANIPDHIVSQPKTTTSENSANSILLQTEKHQLVQEFLHALQSEAPPFPTVSMAGQLYAYKSDAEKWFLKKGASHSQLLLIIKKGELLLITSGSSKVIGPPQ